MERRKTWPGVSGKVLLFPCLENEMIDVDEYRLYAVALKEIWLADVVLAFTIL